MTDIGLAILFGIVAALYAAVGQAGGTGYIAVMGVAGIAPDVIKPVALALNVMVASIACFSFHRAGLLSWRSCYPFAILGAPFSAIGGALNLPPAVYLPVVGGLLLLAAAQMFRSARGAKERDAKAPLEPPFLAALIAGGGIGFVSGVTGVGGGIYLAPVILLFGWATTKQAASISAMFNLLNSGAALLGVWATSPSLPRELPIWLVAVAIGGVVGSVAGIRYLPPAVLRTVLGALLVVAGVRMLFSNW